jgi:hypothetical protein
LRLTVAVRTWDRVGASAVTIWPFRAVAMPAKCVTAPALPLEPCRLSTLGSLQPPRLE